MLAAFPIPLRWTLLIAVSFIFAAALEAVRLPAALFLGPMIAAILFGANSAELRLPRPAYNFALGILGCMVANLTSAKSFGIFGSHWPLFIAIIFSIIASSTTIGYVMTRLQILPGTVAIWGTSAGGGLPLIVLAEAHGADARLVAFMHNLRVLVVAALSSIIARYWVGPSALASHAIVWFPAIDALPFIETLILAVVGSTLSNKLRLPAGGFLVPAIAGAALKWFGVLKIELPMWLLVINYAFLGWGLGLSFTKQILLYALRVTPQILLSILLLIGACGCMAAVLVHVAQIDPATAYLATSPGSMDSVTIIAANSNADISFVIALQIMRLFLMLFIAPAIARTVARLASAPDRRERGGSTYH